MAELIRFHFKPLPGRGSPWRRVLRNVDSLMRQDALLLRGRQSGHAGGKVHHGTERHRVRAVPIGNGTFWKDGRSFSARSARLR